MLISWEHQQRIELEQLRRAELPIACFQSLFANANRDSKSKPFTPDDFAVFKQRSADESRITPATAAALIALQAEGLLHPLLLTCWSDAINNPSAAPTPEVRALVSEDNAVWVVAPVWEGANVRGLVCVADFVHGPVRLRDIDRRLMSYEVVLPKRSNAAAGWIEAGHLLLGAT